MKTLSILLAASFVFAGDALAESTSKPNIIVIFSDDHGYSDLGCQGIARDLKTPNIDALAAGGVRMTSGYVSAPQCVPSRAGLLTGRYQNRFGVESNGMPLDGFNAERTIAERLKKAGYATGMTGKWHLGTGPDIVKHGFDDVYFKSANRPGWSNFDLDGSDRMPGPEKSGLYHLDANSAAACAFIRRHHDEPFFFYCAYRAPHVPLDAPKKYLDRFPGEMAERRRQALAMISAMDDGVGKIAATLREFDLEEKTLLFYIGDNGAPLKIHKLDTPGGGPGWDGSLNDPLNGEKGMLSEGGIRVSFVGSWKGHIQPGLVYDQPVISLDVAATAVALAGLPADPKLDGVNLIPFLERESNGVPHRTLYWRWIAQSAVREGKWKYLRGGQREYLFDLEADREEKQNLAGKHPEIAKRLSAKLTSWSKGLSPPGLTTKPMSETWEQYFDFYLDGKPAPKPRAQSTSFQGWVVRGGKGAIQGGRLKITPSKGTKQSFIAASGFEVAARNLTAVIRMQVTKSGSGGIAWRQSGQKDFVAGQSVGFNCNKTEAVQEHRVSIPATADVIHLRLLLPPGGAEIASIELRNGQGRSLKAWRFDK